MSQIIPEIIHLLDKSKLIPFIGAGLSESCGCPSGQTLAQQLLIRFQTGHENITKDKDLDLLRLAEYLKIAGGDDISGVLSQIHGILNENSVDISKSEAHLLLAQLGVPIIYTTNYDRLIERSFEHLAIPYQTIVSTQDIIESAGSTTAQIVKFHGSLEQDESIVLTESDYYERLEFVTPIDIKLRADALGKSLLFIGYSFSDFNVRYLWFKLRKMTKDINERNLPDSYILLFEPDEITTTLLTNRGIVPIDLSTYNGMSKTEKLCSFLRELVFAKGGCQGDGVVDNLRKRKTPQPKCCGANWFP